MALTESQHKAINRYRSKNKAQAYSTLTAVQLLKLYLKGRNTRRP